MALSLVADLTKPFSVVLFPKENTYAVVPGKWLFVDENLETWCWCPSQSTQNGFLLQKSPESVPDSTFEKHPAQMKLQ